MDKRILSLLLALTLAFLCNPIGMLAEGEEVVIAEEVQSVEEAAEAVPEPVKEEPASEESAPAPVAEETTVESAQEPEVEETAVEPIVEDPAEETSVEVQETEAAEPVPEEPAVDAVEPETVSPFIQEGDVLKGYTGEDEVVIIPDGVRVIAANAFKGNTAIKEIILSESVEEIGDAAFEGCSGLEKVTGKLIESLKVGTDVFKGTKVVNEEKAEPEEEAAEIEEDEKETVVGESMAEEVVAEEPLTDETAGEKPAIEIPEVEEPIVEEAAAEEEPAIEVVVVSEAVEEEKAEETVSEETVEETIEEITVSDEGEVITDPDPELGSAATAFVVPEGYEITGDGVDFADVLGVSEWDEVADVLGTNTGSGEFAVDASQNLIQYNGTDTVVQIPLYVMYAGSPVLVKGIEDSAFAGNTIITEIIIPTSVTWIDTGAFKGCTALESINLPDNVTSISVGAFEDCTSLKSVSWSDSVNTIMDRAFYNCGALQTLGSSSSVTKIGDYAFYGCGSLKAITWSNKLTNIGKYSYANCVGLTGLSFPATLATVDDFAFSGCTNILKVEFQGDTTLKTISTGAFRNCTSLTAIYIPDSVTTLGNSAFENCASATVLSLPASLKIIQDFTFKNCSSLTTLRIPNGVTDIHREAFYGCSNIEYVYTIPISVGFIGNYAFYGLKSDCVIVVDNTAVVIGIDGLGLDSIVFGWLGSTAEAYANAHAGVTFYNMQIMQYVARCYNQILGRTGDPGGMIYWSLPLARKQKSGGDIVHEFMFSNEFARRGLSNADAVEVLYQAMQGRASDSSGKAYWVSALDLGCSYDFVIQGFCNSPEFHGICDTYGINPGYIALTQYRDMNLSVTAFMDRCYRLIQGRTSVPAGDASGLNYWCGKLLRREMTGAAVVAEFLASAEFKGLGLSDADQVERLYMTMMDRMSDPTGKAYWLSFLSQNMTIEYIVKGFADSVEFRFICANYGIIPGPFTPHEYRDWNERATGYVSRIYDKALNRVPPDTYGLNNLTGRMLTKRATPLDVAVETYTSLECQLQWFNNWDFVDRVYEGMLGRAATSTERINGALALSLGMSRRDFVIFIGSTGEFASYAASLGL